MNSYYLDRHYANLPILSCTHPIDLANLIVCVVPAIWQMGNVSHGGLALARPQNSSFRLYCAKLVKTTRISCPTILLALYYLFRLRTAYPSLQASVGSEIRLSTTALVLANKYLEDSPYASKTWSDITGIPLHELNIMEGEFLSALQYRLHVHKQEFMEWASGLQYDVSVMTPPPISIDHHAHYSRTCPMMLTVRKRTAQDAPEDVQPPFAKRPCTPSGHPLSYSTITISPKTHFFLQPHSHPSNPHTVPYPLSARRPTSFRIPEHVHRALHSRHDVIYRIGKPSSTHKHLARHYTSSLSSLAMSVAELSLSSTTRCLG